MVKSGIKVPATFCQILPDFSYMCHFFANFFRLATTSFFRLRPPCPSDLKSDIERHTKHILEVFNFYCEFML